MAHGKSSSVFDMLLALPWWIGAVLADTAFFSPSIAKQIYPPIKSPEGLPIYNDIVHTAEGLSIYLTVAFALFAVAALVRKTMLVRNKAHNKVKRSLERQKSSLDCNTKNNIATGVDKL